MSLLPVVCYISSLALLAAGCGKPTPEYARVAESFLAAVQSGELTSVEDLRGVTGLASGTYKKFKNSPFAKDEDFEFPSASVIGKIVGFKMLTDEPTERKVEGLKGSEPAYCESVESMQKAIAERETITGSLAVGDSRYFNFSSADGACRWDEVRGMRLLTYSVETTKDFVKITFMVDRDSMWMIDVHK